MFLEIISKEIIVESTKLVLGLLTDLEDHEDPYVNKVIEETEVKSLAEIGRVMPLIMERGKDKIDGKIANKILRELLE